jgi:hypothetical protein
MRCDVDDAVVKEAKRRARRRRWSYCAVAATALATVAAFALWGQPPPLNPHPYGDAPASGAAVGAGGGATDSSLPVAGGPDRDAKLVEAYGPYAVTGGPAHGWVLVYSDAYVIRSWSGLDPWARRLTEDGLERVRSGAIEPSAFLTDTVSVRGLWAEPKFRPYGTPMGYVACHDQDSPNHISTAVLAQLPADAQALLRGTEQSYDLLGHGFWRPGASAVATNRVERVDCFALTDIQAHALALTSSDPRRSFLVHGAIGAITLEDVQGAGVTLVVRPAFPDKVLVDQKG